MWRSALVLVLVACGSPSNGDDGTDGGNGSGDATVQPPMPLSSDEAAKACVVFGSCMGDGINDCYTDAAPFWSTTEARCVLAAGHDCAAVRACFGMGTTVADPSCSSSSYTCDGTNLVICQGGVRSTISCPNASPILRVGTGSTCVVGTNGALCGDASCSAASGTCTGSVASSCYVSKAVMLSMDCADYGKSCLNGACTAPGGGAACTGTTPTCDGAAIVYCGSGTSLRTDCGSLEVGATCHPGTGGATEPYCGTGEACYPTKGAETCSGTSVNYCAGGNPASLDCTSLGFSACIGGKCY